MMDFDNLSNKELRQKCLEYGLPNVPVTDTSRKVLIKRLIAACSSIDKNVTSSTKKNRRETIHASQMAPPPPSTVNDHMDAPSSVPAVRPSRRTIAATERMVTTTTTVSEPDSSDVSPERVPVPALTKIKVLTPRLYPKLPDKEPSPKPVQLSKTQVVTTSYVLENKKSEEDIPNMEGNYTRNIKQNILNSAYEEHDKPELPTLNKSSLITTAPTTDKRTTTLNLGPQSTRNSNYNYIRRTDMLPTVPSRKPFTDTTKLSNYQHNDGFKTNIEKDDYYYDDDNDDYDDDDDVILIEDSPLGKGIQTPYLSQFARNLENLKTTPLDNKSSIMSNLSNSQYSTNRLRNRNSINQRPRATISARPSLQSAFDSNADGLTFRDFLRSLDQKYHFNYIFTMILIFLLSVFIYVFFIQSY